MKLWKTLNKGLKSNYDDSKWVVGKWRKVEGGISCCVNGFHASKTLLDAFSYVPPSVIARVEVRGSSHDNGDKQAWSEMRIVKTYQWTKKDSVSLAIYSAELVIKNFEKLYPDDKRPREAIEAAKKWLENPTEKNKSAALSAGSAAWSAARSGTYSAAWSAAWSAESAARSAARSAESAAWSAARSAGSAYSARSGTYSAVLKNINKWIEKRIK